MPCYDKCNFPGAPPTRHLLPLASIDLLSEHACSSFSMFVSGSRGPKGVQTVITIIVSVAGTIPFHWFCFADRAEQSHLEVALSGWWPRGHSLAACLQCTAAAAL